MYAYIARQPIFNINKQVRGYELLYRDGSNGNAANIVDGDAATCTLLSDAITLFGLPRLTNQHPAYINFTEKLIRNDYVSLADPKEIVVELLEDITVDESMLERLKELKDKGYVLALDDYAGDPKYKPLLPLVDIIKVDFMLTDRAAQRDLAKKLNKLPVTLLAEKVETAEDFNAAREMGYTLFQGYFFEKPRVLHKQVPSLAASSYGLLLNELLRKEVDFNQCARIIHRDASLTYVVLQRLHTLAYYRGNLVSGIKHALIMMGTEECRRWAMLMMARQSNVTESDELVRRAYLRGLFIESLMQESRGGPDSEHGFLLGMFSLLDKILGAPMTDLLVDVNLDREVKAALVGDGENIYSHYLQYVIVYELSNPKLVLPQIPIKLDEREVADLYMKCIYEADSAFNALGGEYHP